MTRTAATNGPGTGVAALAIGYLLLVAALAFIELYFGDYTFASGVINGAFAAYAFRLVYTYRHGQAP